MSPLYRWIHRVWYEDGKFGWLLLPLSGCYWLLTSMRRFLYRAGAFKTHRIAVPVITVGNITAGGTGKTPAVIWLSGELRARGFSPGIVSRGYGGRKSDSPMRVDAASDAALVGDEPVLLARRTGCPVVVDSDRHRAAAMLVDDAVDVVIMDDGLQHYRLCRDYEICVIDGARGLGNRWLLPAGPLRESPERLQSVDQVLVNGSLRQSEKMTVAEQNAAEFELVATDACRLNRSLMRPLQRFSGATVHAVAGIGNPARFFDMLRSYGMQVIEHAFADHAAFVLKDIEFGDDLAVLMTEKDAVKLGQGVADRFWSVPVELVMQPAVALPIVEQIDFRLRDRRPGA